MKNLLKKFKQPNNLDAILGTFNDTMERLRQYSEHHANQAEEKNRLSSMIANQILAHLAESRRAEKINEKLTEIFSA